MTAAAIHGTAYRIAFNILKLLAASLITTSNTPYGNNEAMETNSIDGGNDAAKSFPPTACCCIPPSPWGPVTVPAALHYQSLPLPTFL